MEIKSVITEPRNNRMMQTRNSMTFNVAVVLLRRYIKVLFRTPSHAI